MKIKHRIFVVFTILFLIPLPILQIVNIYYYSQKMEQLVENDLMVAATTQVEAIENFFNERETDLAVIASYGMIDTLLRDSNQGIINTDSRERIYMEDILQVREKESPFIESISIIDRNFCDVISSRSYQPGALSELHKTDKRYLTPHMQFTSVLKEGISSGEKGILAVREIYKDGEMQGYVVEEVNLLFFDKVRASASLFNGGTIYLIDDKRNIITAGNDSQSREEYYLSKNERSSFSEAWQRKDPDSDRGILKYEARGEQYLSCYISFDSMNWMLLTSINMEEVLETGTAYEYFAVLVLVVLVILFLLVNRILTYSMVRPMENMAEKFKLIRRTKDYSVRMEQSESNEIGIISSEINLLLEHMEKNIKEEKQRQEQLKKIAELDALTGLYNKAIIETVLTKELNRANEKGKQVACMFLDVDDFKQFNSVYGHLGGDTVLKFIGDILKDIGCPAGRIGGDEFVIGVIRDVTPEHVRSVMEEVMSRLSEGVIIGDAGERTVVTCSIGAALSSKKGDMTYEMLIDKADQAMYEVKNNSKNSSLLLE